MTSVSTFVSTFSAAGTDLGREVCVEFGPLGSAVRNGKVLDVAACGRDVGVAQILLDLLEVLARSH
jgi:hypothetical protein